MFTQDPQEEAKLDQMQRHWQLKRGSSTATAFFEEATETEDMLSLPRQGSRASLVRGSCVVPPPPPTFTCSDVELESDSEVLEVPEPFVPAIAQDLKTAQSTLKLDGAILGDFPAQYTICALEPHQFPAIGVYVDKRVVPGFKYRVRPLPALGEKSNKHKCLFEDRALTLKSIGRGYTRRFTFEADQNHLNDNDNYFWSDNRPEGYAFELEVMSVGDKFTIFDINGEAQGTLEVLKIEGHQLEIGTTATKERIEKRAYVKFTGKVEYYETGVAKPMHLTGVVVSVKTKSKSTAEISKVTDVVIRRHKCYLKPGIQKMHRRVTVYGEDINDVPTKYTMTGLEPHEIPVVGTYVDPRVIPGFHYKVRPNDRKEHLFGGRALKLQSIGRGYAKRLTFDSDNILAPPNCLWSDSHPDGLGLEPRAIRKGMKFIVKAGEQILGEAQVFRADKPQKEERMEKIETAPGVYALEKYIHIDVMCHVKLARTGGASTENDENFMRVYGLAVVRMEPKAREAQVVRVENVGLDSQVNVLFAQTHKEITFLPK